MPRIESIETRLLEWARWKLGGVTPGDLGHAGSRPNASGGSIWQGGRSGYVTSTVPTSAVQAAETDAAIKQLPADQQRAVAAYYLRTGTKADAAAEAGMAVSTMFAKVELAHHGLAEIFNDRARAAAAERARVEALQRWRGGV